MVKLESRYIDNNDNLLLKNHAIIQFLSEFSLENIDECIVFDKNYNTLEFNEQNNNKLNTESKQINHNLRNNNYFLEKYYLQLNLEEYFLKLNQDKEKGKQRILFELLEFKRVEGEMFLRFLIKLSEYIKQHDNLLIGIGRGSSISSYLLYLLEIHLINPLEYDLDSKEFFK